MAVYFGIAKAITAQEVARFIESQCIPPSSGYKCKFEKGVFYHYGKQDLRELMDFIFEGEPVEDADKIN